MSQHWGDGHQLCQYQCREWWWRTPNQGRGLKTQNFTIQRSYALDSGLKHGVRKERCSHAYEQVRTLTSDAGADLMERLTMSIDQEEAVKAQVSCFTRLHQVATNNLSWRVIEDDEGETLSMDQKRVYTLRQGIIKISCQAYTSVCLRSEVLHHTTRAQD